MSIEYLLKYARTLEIKNEMLSWMKAELDMIRSMATNTAQQFAYVTK